MSSTHLPTYIIMLLLYIVLFPKKLGGCWLFFFSVPFLVNVRYLPPSHACACLYKALIQIGSFTSISTNRCNIQKGCIYFPACRAQCHKLNSATSFLHPWCLSYHLHPLACSTSTETKEMTALLETPAHPITTTFSPLSPVRGRRKGRDDFLGRKKSRERPGQRSREEESPQRESR